jgi:DNA-binding NtrC family response regulator
VNCAGLSPSLIEAELFGHVQGAFTGASKSRKGYFEAANGGTVFLDEIGDMPLELQTRLLRVLDRGEYNRIGESTTRQVDVRIISATNRDLEAMVREGRFRSDLFYRLRGCVVDLPPLRKRKEDIPALVSHFLEDDRYAVAPEAMDLLQAHDWPGNVRELAMAVANLKGISPGRMINREAVRRVLGHSVPSTPGKAELLPYQQFKARLLHEAETNYFKALLVLASGSMARAAKLAGMHRKNLYTKLAQLGVQRS